MKKTSVLLKVSGLLILVVVLVSPLLMHKNTKSHVVACPLDIHRPATFVADKAHSNLGFRVRHLGIAYVNGAFDEYDARVTFDPYDLSTIQAEATVQVASINTSIERRNNHLRSDDFFNAEAYPTMKFVSTEIRAIEGNTFEMVGDLTIRGITQEVVFESEFLGMGMMGEERRVGFEAVARVNRFDFDLKWDRLTEAGGLVVDETVRIQLDLEMNELVPSEG